MFTSIVSKFTGDPAQRTMSKYQAMVDEINALEPEYQQMHDDELRGVTAEFRAELQESVKDLRERWEEAHAAAQAEENVDQRRQLVQGLPSGAQVEVRLYRNPVELQRTIFVIGSHDLTLDLLAQFLAKCDRRLTSANVGSQGGLIALRRGEAHIAGSHLLDPETGEYNLTYIREYLPGVPVKVVGLVEREQGLMVHRGNPKGLKTLSDLAGREIKFVNRQRGAGTRVLLDYQLR